VALVLATQASAQVTLFGRDGFAGRRFTTASPIEDLGRYGFDDRASSLIVRGGWWEVCEGAGYRGRCATLRPGSYGSLASMGLDDRVSSARPVAASYRGDRTFRSPSGYDFRRRAGERLYEARVTSVHAVVGPPERRCWIEQRTVASGTSDQAIPGAIAGAVIGGILGHQIGGGRGQDVATGIGAIGGAAVGANLGRRSSDPQLVTQDVQRCEFVSGSVQPDHYEVRYWFRGSEHRVQTTSPPGPTILVNARGEPRV
jgi:uncharacterized protein YcfJ